MTDILNAAIALGLLTFAVWAIRRSIRRAGDYRSRNDRIAAQRAARHPAPERQEPGTDDDLLLDAYLAYYGPRGIRRLRNAIQKHRKENQQP